MICSVDNCDLIERANRERDGETLKDEQIVVIKNLNIPHMRLVQRRGSICVRDNEHDLFFTREFCVKF